MRHNPSMSRVPDRSTSRGRAPRRLPLLRLVLAVGILLALAGTSAPVAAAAAPTLANPGNQGPSVAGKEIAPLKISGTEIEGVTQAGLPEGLSAKVAGPSEVEITGTPAKKEVANVVLHATNKEGESAPVEFKWTVVEAPPTIEKPPDQKTVAGQAVALTVHGTNMASLSAGSSLPKGLTLKLESASEGRITGTPLHAETVTVTLKAKNAEGSEATSEFNWIVEPETAPAIEEPPAQTSPVGKAITPLIVHGANMAELTAQSLPAGLSIELLSPSEGRITGTPTKAESVVVKLTATNPEGTEAAVTFKWTVEPSPTPAPSGPTASGTPTVTPGVVFSAARATCVGAVWSGGTVGTQWLLDGAPIAGATASGFVPPRSYDGHALSCRQTATAAAGATSVTSRARMVHEQPPQPSWPISSAALHCASAICMQQGAGPGAVGQAYPQEGAWWGSQQVRCVSAPWTSAVGSSSQPAVRALAEAHTVRLALQRVGSGGVVTLASQQLTGLGAARDLLDGSPTPFGGAIVVPFGSQPFAAGELWSKRFPGAVGHPNWFAAGGGLLAYGVAGAPGAARSFQLTYTLTAADLGSRLRCVGGADDGPAAVPTTATFSSSEYAVSATAACGPRRLGAASLPQPALIVAGEPSCIPAPSSLAALGASPREVAVKGSRAAIGLACHLHGGCRGKLALMGVVGGKRTALTRAAPARVRSGAARLITLKLNARGRRAVKGAGTGGVTASLQLEAAHRTTRLASVRLLAAG